MEGQGVLYFIPSGDFLLLVVHNLSECLFRIFSIFQVFKKLKFSKFSNKIKNPNDLKIWRHPKFKKLALSGPYSPSSLAPATLDKMHPFMIIQWSWLVQLWLLLLCCKQFYASFDGSVRLEMLFCRWKRFYASWDGSVRLEMLFNSWKRFYASFDGSVRLEMLLC